MTAIANHPHRVTSAVAEARAELASVADVALWSMDPDETSATIDQLASLAAQVADPTARSPSTDARRSEALRKSVGPWRRSP
jgi:hypothetical protein